MKPSARPIADRSADDARREAMRIAGDKVHAERVIAVHYPYTGEIVATVPRASLDDVRRAIRIARDRMRKRSWRVSLGL